MGFYLFGGALCFLLFHLLSFVGPVKVSKKTLPQSVADCFVSNKLNNVVLLNLALG